MARKGRKLLYFSNLDFNGTVFRTQVLDWLDLYKENQIEFELIQLFHIKDITRPRFWSRQVRGLKDSSKYFAGFIFLFPSKGLFYVLNTLIIYTKIFKWLTSSDEILIFSRAIVGREIVLLRKFSPVKIKFYFDARAAAAEENRYLAVKENDYSLKRYLLIANIYYLVHQTLSAADKIFTVSTGLKKYFQDIYNLQGKEFVSYPCLSDSSKFYYDIKVRDQMRHELKLSENTTVYIYSGGFDSEWHITEKMFAFFIELFRHEKNSKMICLTSDISNLKRILGLFPELEANILYFSVPNNEVYKFLNSADYGILFRDNTIMNNVASPTKYAEYILCGLPVMITEGVGDYSDFTINHNLGILVRENVLNEPAAFNYGDFKNMLFDRTYISNIGKHHFSKESILTRILSEFRA